MQEKQETNAVYLDPERTAEERAEDLAGRLTLEEKIGQLLHFSPAVPRLGIPGYVWQNECLHGVARAGIATVFPQAIGMAASFDRDLVYRVASVIALEARAKHHEFSRRGDRGMNKGLTFWTPNINIFRDPRWGRGQETYGEDPYLTSRLGVAFIRGLQGDRPKYLKAAACAKHYAVHSGPEPLRHRFNAVVSKKDLRETYLPAFCAAVREGKVEAVMGAYNRVNGDPACASKSLLVDILRKEWGFAGHVVSDCGAIHDIHKHHRVTASPAESAALAVNNGCDLNCGWTYSALKEAVKEGLVSEETITSAVVRVLTTRFKLGMFDPPSIVPLAGTPYEVNDAEDHRRLALEAAVKSIVLLKNENSLLPLDRSKIRTIAVIGPNADNKRVLLGNYHGTPSRYVTALAGIREAAGPGINVIYAEGCELNVTWMSFWGRKATAGFTEAVAAAERADAIVLCLGISPELEGEEGDAPASEAGGDRLRLDLPGMQEELLKAVAAVGKPVILVLFNGSPVTVNWAQENIPAIIEAWYPGEEGGTALAGVLFGDYNPAGRLPVTFVKSLDQLPPFTDYSMKGRTYRYMEEEPLYPFGYGLSYTTFAYSDLTVSHRKLATTDQKELGVSVTVTNTGKRAGEEVVQLYLSAPGAGVTVPKWELKGFERVALQPGEAKRVEFSLSRRQLASIDQEGDCLLEPGGYRIYVGGRQPDDRSRQLAGTEVLTVEVTIEGEAIKLPY
ncbi:MAG: glycoside hydrolase family 3 protein [Firmicutes bacterium]|nr:glycoside hydrolase family 3 protein [Bacillota bacterium]